MACGCAKGLSKIKIAEALKARFEELASTKKTNRNIKRKNRKIYL